MTSERRDGGAVQIADSNIADVVEAVLALHGSVAPRDLQRALGLSRAQASRLLHAYLAGRNAVFNATTKRWRAEPLVSRTSGDLLDLMRADGLGTGDSPALCRFGMIVEDLAPARAEGVRREVLAVIVAAAEQALPVSLVVSNGVVIRSARIVGLFRFNGKTHLRMLGRNGLPKELALGTIESVTALPRPRRTKTPCDVDWEARAILRFVPPRCRPGQARSLVLRPRRALANRVRQNVLALADEFGPVWEATI